MSQLKNVTPNFVYSCDDDSDVNYAAKVVKYSYELYRKKKQDLWVNY